MTVSDPTWQGAAGLAEEIDPLGESAGDTGCRLPVRVQAVLPLPVALGRTPLVADRAYPIDQPGVVLTFSGTAAVFQAFLALAMPVGSVALCPSYNCGHEIEPLSRLGLGVRCYRVTSELEPDLEDIERRMDRKVKALLVTHFFGFGQPLEELRALCDRRGVFLIEDCAHAFLSDNASGNLGHLGDAAIYSIRKTVPLPNGGAVIFNNPSLAVRGALEPPPLLTTWLKGLELARKSAVDRLADDRSWRQLLPLVALAPLVGAGNLLQRCHPVGSATCYDPDDDDFNFNPRIMGWGMAACSRRLLDRLEWRSIAARRRHNYRFIVEGLGRGEGYRVLRPELPDYACPLFLPVLVDRRVEVFQHLLRHRIYSAIWWDQRHPVVPWEEFPEASELKEKVLSLPVHQDLDQRQLEYLVATLRSCPAW
jgi:perosamine synthetase